MIPVKDLGRAKGRLAEVCSDALRRKLGEAMLRDVLDAASGWDLRFVVTGDDTAAAIARAGGCAVVPDPGGGLNAAVDAGAGAAVSAGAGAVLVMQADVPLVSPADIAAMFGLPVGVAVAASDDGGTAALLRRPPGAIAALFGPDSASLHAAAAQAAGIEAGLVRIPGLALDVDEPADLLSLAQGPAGKRSVGVAAEILGTLPERPVPAAGRASETRAP